MEEIGASIITIGDELLIGQVIDTNSAWMAQELNKAGIWVKRRVAVGDRRDDILQALDAERRASRIILITGGLGPTADDITKPLLTEYFHTRLVVNEEALDNIRAIFAKLGRPMIERNRQQAEVPESCTVIPNTRGTAPGMWFEEDGCVFVSMPGVPHEMKGMMTRAVIPALVKRFSFPSIGHRTLLTAGIGESWLADHIRTFEESLPAAIRLAYLPNYGMVRLRLTAAGGADAGSPRELDERFAELKRLCAAWMVADEDISLEEKIGRLLVERGATLATAESCTGGNVAHLITAIPGASEWYRGGLVPYANDVKQSILCVTAETLQTVGAVSEETVRQMVRGALDTFGTDFALATSGIMGPGGGTAEKPVGLVWIAAGNRNRIVTEKQSFRFDRERNIQLASVGVLNLLRKFILSPAGEAAPAAARN